MAKNSHQKVPKSDFQSQFSSSKIIRIILKKNFIGEYQFRTPSFVKNFFDKFNFKNNSFLKLGLKIVIFLKLSNLSERVQIFFEHFLSKLLDPQKLTFGDVILGIKLF